VLSVLFLGSVWVTVIPQQPFSSSHFFIPTIFVLELIHSLPNLTTKQDSLRLTLLSRFLVPFLLLAPVPGEVCTGKISSPTLSAASSLPFHNKHLPLRTARSSRRPRLSLITPGALDNMPSPPALGAVGMTFTVMRAMQGISLISVIGMAANFVSETVNAGYYAPAPLVGALVVVCSLSPTSPIAHRLTRE
jgi:hypothetical protein